MLTFYLCEEAERTMGRLLGGTSVNHEMKKMQSRSAAPPGKRLARGRGKVLRPYKRALRRPGRKSGRLHSSRGCGASHGEGLRLCRKK